MMLTKIKWLIPVVSSALIARCGLRVTVPSARIDHTAFVTTKGGIEPTVFAGSNVV